MVYPNYLRWFGGWFIIVPTYYEWHINPKQCITLLYWFHTYVFFACSKLWTMAHMKNTHSRITLHLNYVWNWKMQLVIMITSKYVSENPELLGCLEFMSLGFLIIFLQHIYELSYERVYNQTVSLGILWWMCWHTMEPAQCEFIGISRVRRQTGSGNRRTQLTQLTQLTYEK